MVQVGLKLMIWETGRQQLGGCGTQTAALAAGGKSPVGPAVNNTETWNGTNWSEVNDLNTIRRALPAVGTTSYALAFGGIDGPGSKTAVTEQWNGTNWTEVNDLNTARLNFRRSRNIHSGFSYWRKC